MSKTYADARAAERVGARLDTRPAPAPVGTKQAYRATDIGRLEAGTAVDARRRGSGQVERGLVRSLPMDRQLGDGGWPRVGAAAALE